jgi:hypothetical protein
VLIMSACEMSIGMQLQSPTEFSQMKRHSSHHSFLLIGGARTCGSDLNR